jgi:hypothetical protein
MRSNVSSLIFVEVSARHAALPSDLELPDGFKAWTWLPLTPQQAVVFGWQALFDDPDAAANAALEADGSEDEPDDSGVPVLCVGPVAGYKLCFPDGNETRLRYIVTADGLRTEFRISSRWLLPDPTDHIREGISPIVLGRCSLQGHCWCRHRCRLWPGGSSRAGQCSTSRGCHPAFTAAELGYHGCRGSICTSGVSVWLRTHTVTHSLSSDSWRLVKVATELSSERCARQWF